MFDFIKNFFKHPYQDQFDAAKAKGDIFYISGGDFGMEKIFTGKTKQETVDNAFAEIKAAWPDFTDSFKDVSKDPSEQENVFRQTLETFVQELK